MIVAARSLSALTPTLSQAEAISGYSHLFRQPEGLYLSPPSADKMEEDFLDACQNRELDLVSSSLKSGIVPLKKTVQIVVSDGEQILGIGDQVRKVLVLFNTAS